MYNGFWFWLVLLFAVLVTQQCKASSITLLNSTNAFCEQDIAQFRCIMNSPGRLYEFNQAGLSLNGSSECYTAVAAESVMPRIHFTSLGNSSTSPSGIYTISPYLKQDASSTYRCCAPFNNNTIEYTEPITLLLAMAEVSSVDITNPKITLNADLFLSLEFIANRTFEVNYTVYAITNFTNGSSDDRAILTKVQNSSKMLSLTIHIPYLTSGNPPLLRSDVQSISILVTAHSQCKQNSTISSEFILVALPLPLTQNTTSTTIPITTHPTTTTPQTFTSTSLNTTSIISSSTTIPDDSTTAPSSEVAGQHCQVFFGLDCYSLSGTLGMVVILLILLLIGCISCILLIMFFRRKNKNKVNLSHAKQLFNTEESTTTGTELSLRPTYIDNTPVYSQVNNHVPTEKNENANSVYTKLDKSSLSDCSDEEPVIPPKYKRINSEVQYEEIKNLLEMEALSEDKNKTVGVLEIQAISKNNDKMANAVAEIQAISDLPANDTINSAMQCPDIEEKIYEPHYATID